MTDTKASQSEELLTNSYYKMGQFLLRLLDDLIEVVILSFLIYKCKMNMLLFYYNPPFTRDPSKQLLIQNIVGRIFVCVCNTCDSTADTQSEKMSKNCISLCHFPSLVSQSGVSNIVFDPNLVLQISEQFKFGQYKFVFQHFKWET